MTLRQHISGKLGIIASTIAWICPLSPGRTLAGSAPCDISVEIPATAHVGVRNSWRVIQELLNFYAAITAAATTGRTNRGMNSLSKDQFTNFELH
jgi:hypothetical protein